MIKKIRGEIWKPLRFKGWRLVRNKYALSSHGRLASYQDDLFTDGKLLEGSRTSGYKTLNLHLNSENGTIYIHREVAKLFIKKNNSKQRYVVHVNHDKSDNHIKNLKWASQKEVNIQQKNPGKSGFKKSNNRKYTGLKLTDQKVKAIKTILNNPDRKLTHQQIADKYKVSCMTIYRIKSGENWGHI